ncbi:MAG: exodeoxyribonuclease V subunit beta [Burkholderiaceae bacterium]|nr:exodeoxyribonuclease V subunit beta [Burkholderiaceae bacterium]
MRTLNAIDFPLSGSRLIEASAGTGKTWTIAALYLRLVLGHGDGNAFVRPLSPAEILVMTFTRAATRELSDRIRARLLEAARCFRGEAVVCAGDDFLAELLAAYPPGTARTGAAWRLATAAEGMDDAAVHTIDAWCQRMLREHAFDSGCLFDEELSADERAVQTEAAQDYWRQQCYPLHGEVLEVVLKVWGNVEALVKDMHGLSAQTLPEGVGVGSLGDVIERTQQQRQHVITTLKQGWAERVPAMQQWLDEQVAGAGWDGRKLAPRHYTGWLVTIAAWAQNPAVEELELTDAAQHRFSPDGLQEARKAGAPQITLPEHFQALADVLLAQQALPKPSVALRLHAAARVQARMAELKKQSGRFGFADMLQRLDQALAGPNSERLRARIIGQYTVALVDEFQDTSPLQYRIFDRLYRTADNDASTVLLLIGDPKQSIYGFRGADIYSYLAARRATAGRHYILDTNYRSTQALVGAVNHVFAYAEERPGAGAFLFRAGAQTDNPLPFVKVKACGRPERFQTADGLVPALLVQHHLELHSAQEHRSLLAALCAQRIVTWLNDAQAGFAQEGQPLQRLRPADIAVLVRSGVEAAAVRRALQRRGVASVYLSDKNSVFTSDEAHDLQHWLHAVAAPLDVPRVRAGLATRTVGLSLDELMQLATDDEAFDARSAQLRALHGVWQTQGVLTMLRQTLHQLDLPARWLAQSGGERRLTNFLHLAELLQTASAELEGEQALIRWLSQQMQEGGSSGEEQIVRLESDADLVKVVTIYKSKGLEYPVVCLPFACSFRAEKNDATSFWHLADAQGQRSLHLHLSKEALAQADQERQREDLRLLYVALTRARHALWLGFAALKVGNSQACCTHQSAAGYLFGGAPAWAANEWLALLQAMAQGQTDIALQGTAYQQASEVPCTPLALRGVLAPLHPSMVYAGQFERDWGIGSFSQLVRGVASNAVGSTSAPVPRAADDEYPPEGTDAAVTTLVPQRVALHAGSAAASSAQPWHGFTRGALVGNFLHEQLEWLAGAGFALDDNPGLADRLRQRCERAGRAADADTVVQWLGAVARMPLPEVGVSLQALTCVLPEMEFWLPAGYLNASEVDALCRQHLLPGQDRAPLPKRTLHGMLMGFADLVFEHAGRYWVLDYKSNYLGADAGAYHADALAATMAAHRYDVQAALYLLALHRLLRQRLGAQYDPAQQLGGALYLFLRGIDAPGHGVLAIAPPLPLLDALDAMLDREAHRA